MKTSIKALHSALVTAFVIAAPGIAMADRDNGIRYDDELESCVAAVRDQLDLDGVHRIQHVVTRSSARDLGYALTIRTSTYSETSKKEYATYCVAVGNREPSRLKIEEIAS